MLNLWSIYAVSIQYLYLDYEVCKSEGGSGYICEK